MLVPTQFHTCGVHRSKFGRFLPEVDGSLAKTLSTLRPRQLSRADARLSAIWTSETRTDAAQSTIPGEKTYETLPFGEQHRRLCCDSDQWAKLVLLIWRARQLF
jgi:hypothetical protein